MSESRVTTVLWLGAILAGATLLLTAVLYGLNGGAEAAAADQTPPETGSITIIKESVPTDITDFAFNSSVPLSDSVSAINTVAGSGRPGQGFNGGYAGDGGPATEALLGYSPGVAVDEAGNIYIADFENARFRKVIAATGIITTVAGNGINGVSGDGGLAIDASVKEPLRIEVDPAGNLYLIEFFSNRVRMVDAATGIITTVVGTGVQGYSGDGGPATEARISGPYGVDIDSAGNLYIADIGNNRIRKVDAVSGIITTVAGNGSEGFSGDGGPATSAQLDTPFDVAVDGADNLYIADRDNQRVRKVFSATGVITTVAGNGSAGFSGDGGPATSASVNGPNGIGVDSDGNLYIADSNNRRIRKVDADTGIINTAAGNGQSFAINIGDGGPATNATLRYVFDVAPDDNGNYIIGGTYLIREVFEADFFLDHALPDDVDGITSTQVFTGLPAGSHTFTETHAPTWRLNDISCNDGSWFPDLDARSVTVEIISGDNITCTFSNNMLPDLEVYKHDFGATSRPGGLLTYRMGYINYGNATNVVLTDTVPLHTIFNSVASTSGWNCLPDNTAGSVCTLAVGDVQPYQSRTDIDFAVNVDLPLDLSITELENSVTIGDDGNNGRDYFPYNNSDPETTPVIHHGVKLSEDDGQSDLVGKTVTYTLALTNSGFTTDTYDLTLSGNSWPAGLLTDTVGLPAGISATFQVTVTIPGEAGYLDQDTVNVRATSQGNGSQNDSANLTTTALWEQLDLYRLELSGDDQQSGLVGESVTYTMVVTNTGFVSDTIDLSLGGNSWPANLSTSSLELPAGISGTFQVSISIPIGAAYLERDVVAVSATSQGNSGISDTAILTTTAIWDSSDVYQLGLSGDDGQSALIGEIVTYTMMITNAGVTTDTIDLVLSGGTWPASLSRNAIELAAGISAAFQLTVTIPHDAPYLEQDQVTVTATSQGDSSQIDTASLTTTALWNEIYLPVLLNGTSGAQP